MRHCQRLWQLAIPGFRFPVSNQDFPVLIVFYVSGHGFGHAARATQIVNALARLEPAVSVVIRASVPEWFLRASLEAPADISPGEVDTGVVQHDGLSIDEDE